MKSYNFKITSHVLLSGSTALSLLATGCISSSEIKTLTRTNVLSINEDSVPSNNLPNTNPDPNNSPSPNPPGTNPPGTNPPGTNPPGTNPPDPPVTIPPGSSNPQAPKIFNVSKGVSPGEIISVQGENLGSSAKVLLYKTPNGTGTELRIVNRVEPTWMGVKIPDNASGAIFVQVTNSSGNSKMMALNGATPMHLDTLDIVPGANLNIYGRKLRFPGSNPVVTINSQNAPVDLAASNENKLVVRVPSLPAGTAPVISVDNGNGTGPSTMARPESVINPITVSDPLNLGVPWASVFSFSSRVVQAQTPCNGAADDSDAIAAAIRSAAAAGGGTVQLPSGTCRLTKTLSFESKVILQGAGKANTIIRYEIDFPLFVNGKQFIGLRDLTFRTNGSVNEGVRWAENSHSFFQRVSFDIGTSNQLFFTTNKNFIITDCEFSQTGTNGRPNIFLASHSRGVVFRKNTITSRDGSTEFAHTSDVIIEQNRFVRDSSTQKIQESIGHRLVIPYAHRLSIVDNTFVVVNGVITECWRNDGETILSEASVGHRTENVGTVTSATSDTLTDTQNTIELRPLGLTETPENYGLAIIYGKGMGQTRRVLSYSGKTLKLETPFDVIPDTTSRYATFIWGSDKLLIKGNSLTDNPRGIWLYSTPVNDTDIVNNNITNGGGIYIRANQQVSQHQFTPILNVRVLGNSVRNNNGRWPAYMNAHFVLLDPQPFGTGLIGVEFHNNYLSANTPNVSLPLCEEYASDEGYFARMRIEVFNGVPANFPQVLGTIFQKNEAVGCERSYNIGTGSDGTILSTNLPLKSAPNFLHDAETLYGSPGASVRTLIE